MNRYWINQPSKLQAFHDLHGRNVLAAPQNGEKFTRIFFTEGPLISQEIAIEALSAGWNTPNTP